MTTKKNNLYQRVKDVFAHWLTKNTYKPPFPLSDFDRIKHELKTGDVILVEGFSRISRLIRILTRSPWTHAALYIGHIHDVEDVALRKLMAKHLDKNPQHTENQFLIEGMLGLGTILVPVNKYRDFHLRICRPKGLSHKDAQKIMGFAIKALGAPYHTRLVIDMARFLLPWTILPRRWLSSLFTTEPQYKGEVCSALIARAFMSVNFPILPQVKVDKETGQPKLLHRNYRLFTPSDFDYSPYFEIIKYPMFSTTNSPGYRNLPWN